MATAESVKGKIQNIINTANEATGNTAEDLTTAVNALLEGYGQSGESYPVKLYETDFVIDDDFVEAGTNGVICVISTGLSDYRVSTGNEILMSKIICQNTASTSSYVSTLYQWIVPNQGAVNVITSAMPYLITDPTNDSESRRVGNSGIAAYLYTGSKDLSSLQIFGRFNMVAPVAGNYHLELYRTGVVI